MGSETIIVQDEYAQKVAAFHTASQQCASLAVFYVAMSGATMLAKKASMGHGRGFSAWIENIELADGRRITDRTARNYMNLAKELESRVQALPPEQVRPMLLASGSETPAAGDVSITQALVNVDLSSTDDLRSLPICDLVRQVTNEEGLRALYLEWGIVKEPGKRGGHHPRKGPVPTDEELLKVKTEAARRDWDQWVHRTQRDGLKDCTWDLLSTQEKEVIYGVLTDLKTQVGASLTGDKEAATRNVTRRSGKR